MKLLRTVLLFVAAGTPSTVVAQASTAARDSGIVLMRVNQPAKAEAQFEKAVKLEPNLGLNHLWLGRAVGQQAGSASKLKQPFMARRIKASFERAIELDPTLLDARDGLIQFYLQAPGFMGGSADKAKEQQRAIAAQDPVRGHYAASEIAWHAKDTTATEAALRAAAAASPDSVRPVIGLAQRQALWKRNAAAFVTLESFLARHPQDVAVRFQLGRLSAVSGEQLPRGESVLRALLAGPEWEVSGLRPTRAAVHFRLGGVLEKAGRKPEARAAYEEAVRLDPQLQLAKDALKALK